MRKIFTFFSAVAVSAAAVASESTDSVTAMTRDGMMFSLLPDGDVTVAADTSAAHIDLTGTVVIPEQVEIGGVMHTVASVADRAFASNEKVTAVILPSTIRTIGVRAFSNCRITSIDLPYGLDSIGEEAFASLGNFGISSVTIPPTVSYIGLRAFYNAPLTVIRIEGDEDSPLLTIADGAFAGTRRTAEAIYVSRAEPPVLGEDVFRQTELNRIYLSGDAVASEQEYRNADGWKDIPFNVSGSVTSLDGDCGLSPDAGLPVEYYTLSGVRVKAPLHSGVYVMRQGHRTVKMAL